MTIIMNRIAPNSNLLFFFLLLLLLSPFSVTNVGAEETASTSDTRGSYNGTEANDPGSTRAMIGIAIGEQSKVYRYGNTEYPFMPFLSLYYKKLYVKGLSVGYQLQTRSPLIYIEASPFLLGMRDRGADSTGVHERRWTLMGGGGITIPTDVISTNWDLKIDTLGRAGHSGYSTLTFFAPLRFIPGKFRVTPGIFGRFYEKKFVDYYFGVDASEASAARPAYAGKNAYEYGANLSAGYRVDEHWLLTASGSYSAFSGEIANSPIVRSKNRWQWLAGVGYSF